MRWIHTACLLGICAALTACSHAKSRTVADISVAELQQDALVWTAKTDNPLMDFVPEDAAWVMVTQRGQNLTNKGTQVLLDGLSFFTGSIDSEHYAHQARKCGLDPDGNVDAAAYLHDGYAVLHVTVVDAKLATEAAEEFIWDVLDDTLTGYDCKPVEVNGASYCIAESHRVESDEQGWHVYQLDVNDKLAPLKFAIHQDGNVLSVVAYDSARGIPEGILRTAKKPFTPKSEDKNAVLVGRIRYASFIENLLRFRPVADSLDEDLKYALTDNEERVFENLCSEDSMITCDQEYAMKLDEECDSASRSICPVDEDCDCEKDCGSYCYRCEWWMKCKQCAYDEQCSASRYGKKALTAADWLKALNFPSIRDDVCIREATVWMQNITSTEWTASVSDTGAIGLRLGTTLASDDLIRDMKSVMTEHAELKDDDVAARGFIGFSLTDALHGISNRISTKMSQQDTQCRHMQAYREGLGSILLLLDEVKRNRYAQDFLEIQSFAFVVKKIDFWRNDIFPHFWGHIVDVDGRNGTLEHIISEINDEEFDSEYIHLQPQGNRSMIVWTPPYEVESAKYTMVKDKDAFFDLRIGKELLASFGDDIPAWLVSNYHFRVGFEGKDFVLSLGTE